MRQLPTPALSEREIEILLQMREGDANKQIAQKLGLKEKTVQHHIGSLCKKLSATNRTQAVITALRLGLIPLG